MRLHSLNRPLSKPHSRALSQAQDPTSLRLSRMTKSMSRANYLEGELCVCVCVCVRGRPPLRRPATPHTSHDRSLKSKRVCAHRGITTPRVAYTQDSLSTAYGHTIERSSPNVCVLIEGSLPLAWPTHKTRSRPRVNFLFFGVYINAFSHRDRDVFLYVYSFMILPQVHLRKPCYDFYFL